MTDSRDKNAMSRCLLWMVRRASNDTLWNIQRAVDREFSRRANAAAERMGRG